MTNILLNVLDVLPESAKVCLAGSRGRNSRLAKVLRLLRPDLDICRSIDLVEADGRLHAGQPRCPGSLPPPREEGEEGLPSVDCVLSTFYRSRLLPQLFILLKRCGGRDLLIVNPNFYHPFLQFDEEKGIHEQRLKEAQELFPVEGDRIIFDLALSVLRPKSDLQEVYCRLNELYSRMGRQYFDHVNPSVVRTVIEGGVADGWSAVQFLGSFPEATVYGFEPHRETFETSYCSRFLLESGRFQFVPLGLWNRVERLPFDVKRSCTSAIAEERPAGDTDCVDAISIDEFVAGNGIRKVDFIKLDIEGSELRALQGAERTIRGHRPQLAVCIYHRLEHYYEIPFLLSEVAADYVFRIGHYSPFHVFGETVLYAIPKEIQGVPQLDDPRVRPPFMKRNR